MNNEPVAWIIDASMTDCDDNFIWNTGNYPDWQVKDWIPLYTHPVSQYKAITNTKIEPTVVSYTHPVKEQLTDEDEYWLMVEVLRAKVKEQQAEIEKLRSWVEMLVEVPFFDEIDHYRGIPVSILRKAEEK